MQVLISQLNSYRNAFVFFLLIIILLVANGSVYAQKTDTAKKVNISILKTIRFESFQTDSGVINKFIGDVQLQQAESIMYCDSAYLNQKTNNLEAFSNVKIIQPGGTEAMSDYLRYTGNIKLAFMKGNVSLTDGKSKLWCTELTYDLTTKTGTYDQGGTLQNDATTVSSNSGVYDVKNKDSRFKGNVIITDPQYNIKSEDLGYNTETKVIRFFSPSVVLGDKSKLVTSSGTYDSKNEIAHFISRSSITDADQYLEADTINYDKHTGNGDATGHVISIDTAQHSTLYCGHADYNGKTHKLLAVDKPVLKQMNGADSLFMRADTFYSAPVPKKSIQKDSTTTTEKKVEKPSRHAGKTKKQVKQPEIEPATDTAAIDSTSPRFFIGYHHVLIFSDSLQGKCDSISYSQADSILRMMKNPAAWAHNSQITGDTIILKMDSGKLKSIFVPNNALLVTRSGPPKAQMFDQVQGKTLTGHFVNNAITYMVVYPNAESIFFPKDEKNQYLGVNQGTSEKMKVYFKNQKVDRIILEQEPHNTMTPLNQINISTTRLSRFIWLEDLRPKSREELFK